MRVEDLTKTLECTLLETGIGERELAEACAQVREHHVAALYVRPERLVEIVAHLRGCDVKPAVAIDHSRGAASTAQRVSIAERAVAEGAGELDVALDHQGMLAGRFGAVREDLTRVVHAIRSQAANVARGHALVTVTVEAPLLGEKLTRLACLIADEAGVDFAGTGSGAHGPANVQDVETMRDALSEAVGVRAAGGIHGLEAVQELVSAGAARVATADVATVLAELAELNGGGR
ncbi:MAG TPA: hypothetical protein PKE32_03735 [Miltoncostaeaceae bacterium]|nr:hypothetical protein [Miltoncostaeaceae bacterium]